MERTWHINGLELLVEFMTNLEQKVKEKRQLCTGQGEDQ